MPTLLSPSKTSDQKTVSSFDEKKYNQEYVELITQLNENIASYTKKTDDLKTDEYKNWTKEEKDPALNKKISALDKNIKKNNQHLLLYMIKKNDLTKIKTQLDSEINENERLIIKRKLSNYLEKDDKKNPTNVTTRPDQFSGDTKIKKTLLKLVKLLQSKTLKAIPATSTPASLSTVELKEIKPGRAAGAAQEEAQETEAAALAAAEKIKAETEAKAAQAAEAAAEQKRAQEAEAEKRAQEATTKAETEAKAAQEAEAKQKRAQEEEKQKLVEAEQKQAETAGKLEVKPAKTKAGFAKKLNDILLFFFILASLLLLAYIIRIITHKASVGFCIKAVEWMTMHLSVSTATAQTLLIFALAISTLLVMMALYFVCQGAIACWCAKEKGGLAIAATHSLQTACAVSPDQSPTQTFNQNQSALNDPKAQAGSGQANNNNSLKTI